MSTAFVSVKNKAEKNTTYLVQYYDCAGIHSEMDVELTLPNHYSPRRIKDYVITKVWKFFDPIEHHLGPVKPRPNGGAPYVDYDVCIFVDAAVKPMTECHNFLVGVPAWESLYSETGSLKDQLYWNDFGL